MKNSKFYINELNRNLSSYYYFKWTTLFSNWDMTPNGCWRKQQFDVPTIKGYKPFCVLDYAFGYSDNIEYLCISELHYSEAIDKVILSAFNPSSNAINGIELSVRILYKKVSV